MAEAPVLLMVSLPMFSRNMWKYFVAILSFGVTERYQTSSRRDTLGPSLGG